MLRRPLASPMTLGVVLTGFFSSALSATTLQTVPPAMDPRPALVIGGADAEGPYSLYGVSDAFRLSDGRILIVDGSSRELRLFDDQGRHHRTIGRRGSGPGEFRTISGVVSGRGDSLFVFDNLQARISAFAPDGDGVRTIRVSWSGEIGAEMRLYGLAGEVDGGLLLTPTGYAADARPTPVEFRDTLPNLLFGYDGVLRDTVGEFSGMDAYASPTGSGDLVFARWSFSDVHEGRLYITDGGTYGARVYSRTGLEESVVREVRRRPVTDALIDRYIEVRLEVLDEQGYSVDASSVRRSIEEMPRADSLPWAYGLLVDDADHVWVQEYDLPLPPGSGAAERPTRWGVLSPSGAYLGTLVLPGSFRVTDVGLEYVLGVHRDEFDVESIRLHRLTRGSG